MGDVLVRRFGPGGVSYIKDGGHAKLREVAEMTCTGLGFLSACRVSSGVWPTAERRTAVAWGVHRRLASRPDRVELMAAFVRYCHGMAVTPSRPHLERWLHDRDGTVVMPRATKAIDGLERAIRRIERADGVDLAALGALAVRLNELVVALVQPEAVPIVRAIDHRQRSLAVVG